MKRLLTLAAFLEATTGLALMIAPAVVARLLLNADIPAAGVVMGRVTGCALFALGIACWPEHDPSRILISAALAMLAYNMLVTCYLVVLGIDGQFVGVLLWPAVGIHGLLALLLLGDWIRTPRSFDTKA